MLALWSMSACGIPPQTGMYWNPDRSGWGFYIESQNGTVAVAVYAYGAHDGEPEFYIASGMLRDTFEMDLAPQEGMYPIEGMTADLFRVPAGPCLACVFQPHAAAQKIGRIQLMFPLRGGAFAQIRFDDGTHFPNNQEQDGLALERTNFGYATFTAPGHRRPFVPDLRGEWVFVDQSDPSAPAWRFNFSERVDEFDGSDFPLLGSVVFRDPGRNADFYCYIPNTRAVPVGGDLPAAGCELRQNGTTLFWSKTDVSFDEVLATLGSPPPRSSGIMRGTKRVFGRRMSD